MSEHQSLLSIASFKSEASIESLERLVNLDQAKDQSLKLELNQFIGLLQKVKSGNLKSELSVVVSTEQEDYYSFQQKPQDKKDIMYQGFQKCYQEALKTANEKTIEQIEKMNIIYQFAEMEKSFINIQQIVDKSIGFINGLKQSLIESDKEIDLISSQNQELRQQIQKQNALIKQLNSDLNAEKLQNQDLHQKNSHLKNLILVANKQFENLQNKLLQTEDQLNETLEQQSQQIKQLLCTNKALRETINFGPQLPKPLKESQQHQQSYQKEERDTSPKTQRSTPKREWNRNTKTYR
ncbi:hypothetical protein pb186bvf_010561 [Paramecium bursaria]